jgi:hypothetical protein
MKVRSSRSILILENTIGLGVIAFFLFKFSNQDNDFRVFYHAGQLTRHGLAPWNPNDNPQQMFLYGPLTALALTLFTFLKYKYAILLLRVLTLMVAFFGAQYLLRKQRIEMRLSFSLLFLFLFPIKANLEYGGLGIIFAALVWYAFLVLAKSNKIFLEMVAGILISLAIDFKPQIYLPCLILLSLARRVWAVMAILVSMTIGWVILEIINPSSISLYMRSLQNRSKLLSSSIEQMDLRAIFVQINFLSRLSDFLVFSLFVIFALLAYQLRKNIPGLFLFVSLAFMLLPFFHSTDLVLIFALILSTIILNEKTQPLILLMILLSLSMASVWSNSISGALLATISVAFVVILLKQNQNIKIFGYGISAIPVLFSLFVRHFPDSENLARHIFNYTACLVAILAISKSPKLPKLLFRFNKRLQQQSPQ